MPETAKKIGLVNLKLALHAAANERVVQDGKRLKPRELVFISDQLYGAAADVSRMAINPGETEYDGRNLSQLHINRILTVLKERLRPLVGDSEGQDPGEMFPKSEAGWRAQNLRRLGITEATLAEIPNRLINADQTSKLERPEKPRKKKRHGLNFGINPDPIQLGLPAPTGPSLLDLLENLDAESMSTAPKPKAPVPPTSKVPQLPDACSTYCLDGMTLPQGFQAPPKWLRLAMMAKDGAHKNGEPWTLAQTGKAAKKIEENKRIEAGEAKEGKDTVGNHQCLLQAKQIDEYLQLAGVPHNNGQE